MKHIFPDYYNKFHCIADKCTITCCQEWKIGVDADTNRKWKKLQAPETVSEQKKNLSAYTIKKDDKLMRCYHGNTKIEEKQLMNYFFTMSVPVNSMDNPRVETSSFSFSDKRKVSLSIEVGKDNELYYARIMDKKKVRTYKEFKYSFDNKV